MPTITAPPVSPATPPSPTSTQFMTLGDGHRLHRAGCRRLDYVWSDPRIFTPPVYLDVEAARQHVSRSRANRPCWRCGPFRARRER